jgi:hypothetical protein
MKKYSFTVVYQHHQSKGKMYDDCDDLLRKENFQLFEFNFDFRIFFPFMAIFRALIMKRNSIFLIQYPNKKMLFLFYLILPILKAKKIYTIVFIHDIESLRWHCDDNRAIKKDIKNINSFCFIVSHNESMKSWLCLNGIPSSKIFTLKLFDYLSNSIPKTRKKELSVSIASNLAPKKAAYVYSLPQIKDCQFLLYGRNFVPSLLNSQNCFYNGFLSEDKLLQTIEGSFGLVWDGDSLISCSGSIGNYLKYNNPYKVSFYISSDLPIIIWNKAALAPFIKENNIGLVVSSLFEIPNAIKILSDNDYKTMLANLSKLRSKLQNGFYFHSVLNSIELYIEKKM